MSPRLRFASLSLWLIGCAAPMTVVTAADWEIVPAAQRTAIDRESDAELAVARTEITAAAKSLAELPPATAAPPSTAPPTAAPATAARPASDPNARALDDHARTRTTARARVETARAALAMADRALRQYRLDTANARIAVVAAQRELRRGQAIDRNMLGSDTYDTAPLRGQLADTQRAWYAAYTRAQRARAEVERAATELAAAKEAYAQIMLRIPGRPDLEVARVAPPSPPPPPLVLSAWAVHRSDIRRRRGLRHFLDEVAAAPPRLKPTTFKLSPLPPRPAVIAAPTPPAAPAPPTTSAATAAPAISAKSPPPAKPTPAAPKAWDTAELSSGPPIVGTAPSRAATNTIASSTPPPSKATPSAAKPVPQAPAKSVTPSPATPSVPAAAAKPVARVGEPR